MDGDNIGHALRGYADRVVTLHDERKELNVTIGTVYAEAKSAGFDTTTLREIVREMQMEPEARTSRYQLLNEYRQAVGILADTPLGQSAGQRVYEELGQPDFDEVPPTRRGRGRPRKNPPPMFDA